MPRIPSRPIQGGLGFFYFDYSPLLAHLPQRLITLAHRLG